jgi:dipeptidase E
MKLFLSSEGVPRPDLLKQLLGSTNEKPRVALINNAQDLSPTERRLERKIALSELFSSLGYEPVNVDLQEYEGKTEELATKLKTCELIWCSGGNSFWLRYVMKMCGFDKIIKELLAGGIVFGGWSCGAVVAGPYLNPIELLDDPRKVPEIIWEGLGLVDFFVWPHWGKEKYLPVQDEGLRRMKGLPYESVILTDGEAIIIEDGERRIVK